MAIDARRIIEEDIIKNRMFQELMAKDQLIWKKFNSPVPIFNWLSNFNNDEELRLALLLANGIQYYNLDDIRTLWENILNKYVKEYLIDFFSEILNNERDLDEEFRDFLNSRCIFVGLGPAGKSGGAMTYFFGQLPIARNFNFAYEDEFLFNFSKYSSFDYIFLIDDFIGTGTQIINEWTKKNGDSRSFMEVSRDYPNHKFFCLALAGFHEGKARIEQNTIIKVILGEEFSDDDKCFSCNSKIYTEESDRICAKEIMEEKGRRLFSNNPLGFGNLELAVAFFHNTPNNTLPVIWSKKEFWEPLFVRY